MDTRSNGKQSEQETDFAAMRFPTQFTYRIVGSQNTDWCTVIQRCLDTHKKVGQVKKTRESSKGAYCAIQVTLVLDAYTELVHYYKAFAALPGVRYIL